MAVSILFAHDAHDIPDISTVRFFSLSMVIYQKLSTARTVLIESYNQNTRIYPDNKYKSLIPDKVFRQEGLYSFFR